MSQHFNKIERKPNHKNQNFYKTHELKNLISKIMKINI